MKAAHEGPPARAELEFSLEFKSEGGTNPARDLNVVARASRRERGAPLAESDREEPKSTTHRLLTHLANQADVARLLAQALLVQSFAEHPVHRTGVGAPASLLHDLPDEEVERAVLAGVVVLDRVGVLLDGLGDRRLDFSFTSLA